MKPRKEEAKKTLAEACFEKIKIDQEIKRAKQEAAQRNQFKEQEDEMLALMYGPNWKTKQLPGDEPIPLSKAEESHIRLKAS
jgi:hypothetical protein